MIPLISSRRARISRGRARGSVAAVHRVGVAPRGERVVGPLDHRPPPGPPAPSRRGRARRTPRPPRRTRRCWARSEVARGLVDEHLAVAHPGCAGESACRSAATSQRSGGFRGAVVARPLRRGGGEQRARVLLVEHARLEPALVARVLEQAAHEVGHPRDHLAHRHVLADAEAHLRGRVLELVGHPVQHLQLDRLARDLALLGGRERRGDRPRVVRPERELDAPLALLPRHRVEEDLRHPLEARSVIHFSGQTLQGQPICSAWIVS
jgi:hypothetical protein